LSSFMWRRGAQSCEPSSNLVLPPALLRNVACLLEEFRHNDEIFFCESPVLYQPVHLERKTAEGHGRVLTPGLAFYDTQVLYHMLQRKLRGVVRPQNLRDFDRRIWRPHAAQGDEKLLDQARLKPGLEAKVNCLAERDDVRSQCQIVDELQAEPRAVRTDVQNLLGDVVQERAHPLEVPF